MTRHRFSGSNPGRTSTRTDFDPNRGSAEVRFAGQEISEKSDPVQVQVGQKCLWPEPTRTAATLPPVIYTTHSIFFVLSIWIAHSTYLMTFWHVFNVSSDAVSLFTSLKYIDHFITVYTCSLLYSPGLWSIHCVGNTITVNCQAERVRRPKPTYGRLGDLGTLNSHPTYVPLSSFRPLVFCLLRFFDDITVLMTSNNPDPAQDNVQITTIPEL